MIQELQQQLNIHNKVVITLEDIVINGDDVNELIIETLKTSWNNVKGKLLELGIDI